MRDPVADRPRAEQAEIRRLLRLVEQRFRRFYKDSGPEIPDCVPLRCDLGETRDVGAFTVGDLRTLAAALGAGGDRPPVQDEPLRQFALAVLNGYRDGECGDIDGGWLQDKAIELGLIVAGETANEDGEVLYHIAPHLLADPEGQQQTDLELRLLRRQVERMALCPDHRDKATGRCIVCQAEERTRQELADIARPGARLHEGE